MKYLIFMLVLMLGCKRYSLTYNPYVPISVQNSRGEDLLDPYGTDSFTENSIKVSYLENGKEVSPAKFSISKGEHRYVLRIDGDNPAVEGKSSILIHWSEKDIDTLTCQTGWEDDCLFTCTKIWLNDVFLKPFFVHNLYKKPIFIIKDW